MDAVRVETRPMVQVPVETTTLVGRLPLGTDMVAAFWSGVVSGAVYLALMIIFQPIFMGINGWLAMRQYGAILASPQFVTPGAFNLGLLILGLAFVCLMTAIYTAFSVALVRPTSMGVSMIGGLVLGLAFYVVNYYMWSGLFPWFDAFRNWITSLSSVIAGIIAGGLYWSFRRDRRIVGEGAEIRR